MFATERPSVVDLTDFGRFTGRSPRVLGAHVDAAVPFGLCTTSVARFDDLALFAHLNALAEALSPTVIWLLTDCSARLAIEIAKWCERREIFWHYCEAQGAFAFSRR